MSKAKTPGKLVPADAARYLDSDEAVVQCMTAVLEADDPDRLLLAPGAKPRFDTAFKVARALDVRFTAQPASARAVRPCRRPDPQLALQAT